MISMILKRNNESERDEIYSENEVFFGIRKFIHDAKMLKKEAIRSPLFPVNSSWLPLAY